MKIINKPISCIAFHNAKGEVTPMRFQMGDTDKETVKVDRVITKSSDKLAGKVYWTFVCESIIDGVNHRYELKFSQDGLQWVLFKM